MEYVTLRNGVEMPLLGYGVYQVGKDECERCVLDALDAGYRLIDTAQSYFNEEQVGSGLRKSGVPREDIFLTTKVWIEHYGEEACRASVLESMRKLQVEYLDLVLLHQNWSDTYGSWRALVKLHEEGRIRAIGISNFTPDRMVEFSLFNDVSPLVNQIELHPHHQQEDALTWASKYGIQPQAWAPLGEGRGGLFEDEALKEIGERHGKTSAQVMLRWNIQRGVSVLPKSTHRERMEENIDVFDFELSDGEMERIATLDRGQSSFFSFTEPSTAEMFKRMLETRRKQHDLAQEKKEW